MAGGKKQDMSVSILVVDDEPDVAELFRQRFRREARRLTTSLWPATIKISPVPPAKI